jgi:hypothetical protein
MPKTAQNKREARWFAQQTIYEMCSGCARDGVSTCRTIIDPAHFYTHYGECFARVDAEQVRKIESALKSYIPDPLRWLEKIEALKEVI